MSATTTWCIRIACYAVPMSLEPESCPAHTRSRQRSNADHHTRLGATIGGLTAGAEMMARSLACRAARRGNLGNSKQLVQAKRRCLAAELSVSCQQ